MNKQRQGFTLLELIVVIAVIGILAAITIIGFSRYQQDTRDARRASSITAITEALEKYYDENGEYPSCSALSEPGGTVANETLRGIDQSTLVAPSAPSDTSNSLQCEDLVINGDDFFEYEGDGSAACQADDACLAYTLKYKDEGDGTIVSQSSRRTGKVTSAPNLTVSGGGFTSANVSWTTVPNASGYTLQQASNSTFTSGLVVTNPDASATSTSATDLTPGATYYFRISANSIGGSGPWSTVRSVTTNALATPVITNATANSGTQITVTWNDIANESAYTLQYTTSSSSWSSPTPTSIPLAANTTSRAVTGLSIGVTYYFRLQASASGDTSDWSPNASATTTPPAPVCSATGGSGNRQIVPNWDASTGATSYTVQYGPGNYNTEITGITNTYVTINNLNNATTYTSRVKAVVSSTSSSWTNCPNKTTGIDGPTGYGWYAEPEAVRNSGAIAWMPGAYPGGGNWWTNGITIYGSCSPGATIVTRLYSYYAYSNNTSHNNATLMEWTWNNQQRFVVNGTGSWTVWWQGWVACQSGSTRVGDTYLGNAGPY